METKTIENTIDKKIKTIIAESTENKFSLKDTNLSEREWTIKELKKVDLYYKYTFGFSIVAVCTIFIVSLLRTLEIMPTSNSNSSMTSILGIIGVVAGSFHYKIKRERLRTAMYLFDLKVEIEQLKK